ncbi:MAG: alternative ribosome rescue aminoacyl-tRNA hydrolase ArfB [Actinomycetota bacterium]
MSDVRVNRTLTIPDDEIHVRFSPSGGPGGQHANKAATRVDLTWNVASSRALGPRQRLRVMHHLRRRLDASGTLRLTSATHRSQLRNREEVERRLATLVADALRPVKRRTATEPTHASRERRMHAKKRRADVKRMRRAPEVD